MLLSAVACAPVSSGQSSEKTNGLTDVSLRMARSLETEGSPAPFLESALREKNRLEGKGIQAFPASFTEARVSKVLASWKGIEGPLQLRDFTKASGRDIRYGIQGHWQKSIPELLADETKLSSAEKKRYETLLGKERFQKGDVPAVDSFYSNEWERLSQQGREQMSRRLQLGLAKPMWKIETPVEIEKGTLIAETLRQYEQRVRADIVAGREPSLGVQDLKSVLRRGATMKRPKGTENNWHYLDAKRSYQRIEAGIDARKSKVKELMPPDAARRVIDTLDEVLELLIVAIDSEFKGRLMEKR